MLQTIYQNFQKHKNKLAFCINENEYSYGELASLVEKIQNQLYENKFRKQDVVILHTYDDIYTYASIFAIWFSGGIFVPINLSHPQERNKRILSQIKTTLTLSSHGGINLINTKDKIESKNELTLEKWNKEMLLYIIFTSGSTGIPKGVKMSLDNITSYVFSKITSDRISKDSRFLQIYDLTFDASFQSYLLPIVAGASVFTISPKKIKYLEALRIMDKHQISYAKINNSLITFLKPYFNQIKLPYLKLCIFAGEGLDYNLLNLWKKCIPNATVQNVYGPTEATINTHVFEITLSMDSNKTHNGVVAIGKPFGENLSIIVDKNNIMLPDGEQGEICLGGPQVTAGYWNDPEKNKTSFFTKRIKNTTIQFYKTGDLAYIDPDGDYIFCGRLDEQVKIQGYRIELSEIENRTKQFGKLTQCKCVTKKNKLGLQEIFLFIENFSGNLNKLKDHLQKELPIYMLPHEIILTEEFPHTTSDKIDKQKLATKYLK